MLLAPIDTEEVLRLGKRHLYTGTALLLSAMLLVSACSGSGSKSTDNGSKPADTAQVDANKPQDGGTLTIATTSDIVSLNPLTYDDTASGDLINLVFAPLYDVSAKGDLVVDDWSLAAEPYKVSADGKTYTVKIKPNAKWSDGSPVTADDVAFTFQTFADPKAGLPAHDSFASVAKVEKVDNTTVNIILKEVDATFELNALNTAIVPAKVFKDVPVEKIKDSTYGKDVKTFISNGPYKWAEWAEKQYNKLVRDPNYWGKKPNIDTIIYKIYADQNTEVQALLKGEVDFIETVPVAQLDAVKANSNLHIFEGPGPAYDYIGFNFKPDNWPGGFVPFAGAKTRLAINYAINRKGMVDSVLKGHGTLINGPFLPDSWANTPEAAANFQYDANKAKQLLAEDGWKAGSDGILVKDGHKFEFDLMFNSGNKRRESYAAIIQQNLQDVGIKVNLKPMDFSALVDQYITPGKFQALLLGWQLSLDPDARSLFSSKFFPPAGQNSGFYKNEKTDALWDQARTTSDKAKRKAAYAEILKEFANDPPYVFIAQQNIMTAYNDRVHWAKEDQPVQAIPYGYTFHIFNWWVTK